MSKDKLRPCPDCDGDGVIFQNNFIFTDICDTCGGTGIISVGKQESGLNVENKEDIDKYALQLQIVE